MTFVSITTLVVYGLLIGLLVAASIVDGRYRRVPNALTGTMALLWFVWQLALGVFGALQGSDTETALLSQASAFMGLSDYGFGEAGFIGGFIGAAVLGGGLLALTVGYEALTGRESFGGGDIKLMAALGLFLGVERGMVCLLVACVLSLLWTIACMVVCSIRKFRASLVPVAAEIEDADGIQQSDCSGSPGFLARTMPFVPFISLGVLVALVA